MRIIWCAKANNQTFFFSMAKAKPTSDKLIQQSSHITEDRKTVDV